MARVVNLRPGETGYIGDEELYSAAPGRIPCIMPSIGTHPSDVLGTPLMVRRDRQTLQLEVTVPAGVKATHHPAVSINPAAFMRVVMVLPDGRRIDDRIPEDFCQPW